MRRAPSAATHFIVIAVLVSTGLTYAITLAATLFLNHLGASAFPWFYMLFALVSVPAAVGMSRYIDRLPRIGILQGLLGAGAGLTLLLVALTQWLGAVGFFLLYLTLAVFELLAFSVYYTLFADYFTTTDGKRQSTRVAAAISGGALVGAGLVVLTSTLMPPLVALYWVPVLLGLAAAQLLWLQRTRRPVGEPDSAEEESILEYLGSFPKLLRRYPIVALLAAGVFFNNFLYCIAEYNAFDVYAETYTDAQALGAFMGIMVGIQNIIGFVLSLFVTPWLIRRYGVAGANLVYPLLLLPAFLWLAADRSLPAAIYAHIVYDPVANSIDLPVFVLNYNAVPHRFVGRVRLINDGVVYSLSLASAGILLLVLQATATTLVINIVAVALAMVYVLVAYSTGRHYIAGIKAQLREGSVELDGLPPLAHSPDLLAETRTLLGSSSELERALGLELAADGDIPALLPDLARALDAGDETQALLFLERLQRGGAVQPYAMVLAGLPIGRARLVGLHLLAWRGAAVEIPPGEIAGVTNATERALWAVIHAGSGRWDTARAVLDVAPLDVAACVVGLTALRHRADPALLPLLAYFRQSEDPMVLAEILPIEAASGAAAAIATAGEALDSPHPVLRHAAIEALSRLGPTGLATAQHWLSHAVTEEGRDAAIAVCGRYGSDAEEILLGHLETKVFPVTQALLALLPLIPDDDEAWQPLAVAVKDGLHGATHVVIQVLSAMNCPRTFKLVRTLLQSTDPRLRSSAVETLASLPQRRYVAPLLPFLEAEVALGDRVPGNPDGRALVLQRAVRSDNPWVRRASALVARRLGNPAPSSPPADAEIDLMIRLLFLKNLALFKAMSLEHLRALDAVMTSETYLAGECVVREGDEGDQLFLVQTGRLVVRKEGPQGAMDLATLQSGEMFGEMALFDDQPRAASVLALEDSSLLVLGRDPFQSLARQRPDVLWEVCRILTARLRSA